MDHAPWQLTVDDQIRISHELALSYWGNPRNFEYPHRRTVELKARKIAALLSPLNRCFVSSEYNFWPWLPAISDDAPDMVAGFNDDGVRAEVDNDIEEEMEEDEIEGDSDWSESMADGSTELHNEGEIYGNASRDEGRDADGFSEVDQEGDVSLVSTASTVRLGNIHFRACDVAIFYTHLANELPAKVLLEGKWVDIPLALIEIKRNASRKLTQEKRIFPLYRNLIKAQQQIGQQADLLFTNHRYNRQQFVIGIAMVAEIWSYAEFWRRDRPLPSEGDTEVKWDLPKGSWSKSLVWGSEESETEMNRVMQRMEALILSCGITPVL